MMVKLFNTLTNVLRHHAISFILGIVVLSVSAYSYLNFTTPDASAPTVSVAQEYGKPVFIVGTFAGLLLVLRALRSASRMRGGR